MSYTIVERAALIALMAMNREVANTELKEVYGVDFQKRYRARAEKEGLITVRKEKGKVFFTLNKAGADWISKELTASPPEGAGAADKALYALMNTFGRSLAARDISLQTLLRPPVSQATSAAKEDLEAAILAAVVALANRPGDWVDLKDLRSQIPGDRAAQDAALKKLRTDKRIDITLRADQGRLTQEDRDAAIRIGPKMMHRIKIRS